MIVTIFRSRLRPDCQPAYDAAVESTASLAEAWPGFKSHKLFTAADGERLTLVEFESEEAQRSFNRSREHVDARIAGRAGFYAEYSIQICQVLRESSFKAK